MGFAVVSSAVVASSDDKHKHDGETCDDDQRFHGNGGFGRSASFDGVHVDIKSRNSWRYTAHSAEYSGVNGLFGICVQSELHSSYLMTDLQFAVCS